MPRRQAAGRMFGPGTLGGRTGTDIPGSDHPAGCQQRRRSRRQAAAGRTTRRIRRVSNVGKVSGKRSQAACSDRQRHRGRKRQGLPCIARHWREKAAITAQSRGFPRSGGEQQSVCQQRRHKTTSPSVFRTAPAGPAGAREALTFAAGQTAEPAPPQNVVSLSTADLALAGHRPCWQLCGDQKHDFLTPLLRFVDNLIKAVKIFQRHRRRQPAHCQQAPARGTTSEHAFLP